MRFIHVKNLERYQPGYKDRATLWIKVYLSMISGDPDFELIENEIDKWRFVALIMLETQAKKPLPDDERYWRSKGFDLKKRSMSLTLKMLQDFIDCVTEEIKPRNVEERREEKKRAERATPPTLAELTAFCHEIKIPESDGAFYHFKWEGNGFKNGGRQIKDWKAVLRSHKLAGYLPSQKSNGGKPHARETDKPQPRRKVCEFGCGAMLTEQQAISHPDSCPKFKAPTSETMKAVNEGLKILSKTIGGADAK